MFTRRIKGSVRAYKHARGFDLGVLHSFFRAARYATTGSVGRYRLTADQLDKGVYNFETNEFYIPGCSEHETK